MELGNGKTIFQLKRSNFNHLSTPVSKIIYAFSKNFPLAIMTRVKMDAAIQP
jgi:hypothetical protein